MAKRTFDPCNSQRFFLFFSCLFLVVIPVPAFGQIDLSFSAPEFGNCGFVSVNGGVHSDAGAITGMTWDWGDGVSESWWFPAQHEYKSNGSYSVQVTAHDNAGNSLSEGFDVTIESAQDPGCELEIDLHPSVIYLRDGRTRAQLRVEIRDVQGRPLEPATQDLQYEVTFDEIGDLAVSGTGEVTATGYGHGTVAAIVGPAGRRAQVDVFAGHLRTAPVFQYLSVNGQNTGQVRADMAHADGTPVDLSEHELSWFCVGCDPGEPLQLDPDGTVHVVEDYEPGDPAPLRVIAVVDGRWAQDEAVIHVSEEDLALELKEYPQQDTIVVSPLGSVGYDFDAAITDYKMPELFQRGFEIQKYLMSGIWEGDGRAGVVNYTSHYRFDGVFPGCGGSGNPIRMGTNMDEPTASCFFNYLGERGLVPKWGTLFHELGHGFTVPFPLFGSFIGVPNAQGFTYAESLATAAGMFTCETLLRAGESAGVTPEIAQTLVESWLCWHHGEAGWVPGYKLALYIDEGADYSTIDPDVVDDILWVLVEEFDYGLIYRLYGMFTPVNVGAYPFELLTEEQQATMFVAGCSVAAGVDLRSRFHDEWGFPIDEDAWDEMYPAIERKIKARYPASNAGEDWRIEVGTNAWLKDAYVFDRDQDDLTIEWSIVSQPPGAHAVIDEPSLLNPLFTADTPGEYVLSLRASDQWVQGETDTVTITVFDPEVIFSSGFEGDAP